MRPATRAAHAISSAVAALLLAAGGVDAADRVFAAPGAVEPLAPGSRVPSARVVSAREEPVDLSEQVRERGALLVFYRGGW